ncbi:MAG: zeta toxin family protein, partial [Synergistaceae bacterium]|nr:zeta toxin family protein [Synergistaceae bacterium]
MAENNENFSLTHEEHRRIFEELKRQHLEGRKASRKPQAIILLGQPGSVTDSLMTSITQNFSDKNFVMINGEKIRKQHPKYEQSAVENDIAVLGQITAEVQDCEKSLIQTAIKGQLNLVIKDSHCEAVAVSETLKRFSENGYTNSIYLISAHERESILSLYQEHEEKISTHGYSERPRISEHDKSYENLPETVRKIENEKFVDEIFISDSQGQIFYRNKLQNNEWTQKPESAKVLEENRNRAWTAEEISKYQKDWNALIKMMNERGVSRKELEEVAQVRNRCLKSLKIVSQEKIAELNKVEENEIESAVSLLKNPRSLDNSSFRGYEASAQQNDTLDVLEQIKKNVQENKIALEKLKQAGLSPEKDIMKNKIVK